MAKYLISFPASAMRVPPGELAAVGEAAHAVVREAKAAGVYVFAGGIDPSWGPVTVAADGTVSEGGCGETAGLDGGFCVLEVASAEEAAAWAAKLARACGCPQEVRRFGDDPEA